MHCRASDEIAKVIYYVDVVIAEVHAETESDHVCFLSGKGVLNLCDSLSLDALISCSKSFSVITIDESVNYSAVNSVDHGKRITYVIVVYSQQLRHVCFLSGM